MQARSQRLTDEPTILYRLFAADDTLLYVGVTSDCDKRLAQHAESKRWWPDVARATTEEYANRRLAFDAEHAVIRSELPLYNRLGYPTGPRPKHWRSPGRRRPPVQDDEYARRVASLIKVDPHLDEHVRGVVLRTYEAALEASKGLAEMRKISEEDQR